MVYEENFHSRTRVFRYIENFSSIFSNSFPYMVANLWYVSWLAEIYTRIPEMHRIGVIVMSV